MLVDLSRLPPPNIVEEISFEAILAERKERFVGLYPDDEQDAIRRTLALESEPIVKQLRENAYREMILRQRINEASKASLLAYAAGDDLDNRAADYGVARLLITPADHDAVPPVAAVWEDDERLRYRCQIALEGLSVAGSRGAYTFHAMSVSANIADVSVDSPTFSAVSVSTDVRAQLPAGAIVLACTYDAGLASPMPGDVSVSVLPQVNSAQSGKELVAAVETKLSDEDVRPLTDRVIVQESRPKPYRIIATVEPEIGPDAEVVMDAARKRLDATVAELRKLAGGAPRSAIYAALHATGVRRVVLIEPAEDFVCDPRHYPDCSEIKISRGQL